MSTRTKSPLHPSALSINDMRVGRRIIRFNIEHGIMAEGIIVRGPYMVSSYGPDGRKTTRLKVDILNVSSTQSFRIISSHTLGDMGVIAYTNPSRNHTGWNGVNFTIDARKRRLLPDVAKLRPVPLASALAPASRIRNRYIKRTIAT